MEKTETHFVVELFMSCFPYVFDKNIDNSIRNMYYSEWPKSTDLILSIGIIITIFIFIGMFLILPTSYGF